MITKKTSPKNMDQYIAGFPQDVQVILEEIRVTVRKTAPDAEETIKYGMPTFILKGNLVYFGAFKKHIGFYPPTSTGSAEFRKELSVYEGKKGALKFSLVKPIPYGLIDKIVRLRVKENLERATTTGKKK